MLKLHLLHKVNYCLLLQVLVDGPVTGVPRIPIRLNQIRLTKYLVKFPFKGATRVVRQAWEKSDVLKNWKGGQWSNNLAKRKLVSFKFHKHFSPKFNLLQMMNQHI